MRGQGKERIVSETYERGDMVSVHGDGVECRVLASDGDQLWLIDPRTHLRFTCAKSAVRRPVPKSLRPGRVYRSSSSQFDPEYVLYEGDGRPNLPPIAVAVGYRTNVDRDGNLEPISGHWAIVRSRVPGTDSCILPDQTDLRDVTGEFPPAPRPEGPSA